jgi:uncharacterized protein YceK
MAARPQFELAAVCRSVCGCLALAMMSACSTVETHTVSGKMAAPYSGTSLAWRKTAQSTSDFTLAGETWIYAFDIPLCIAADTLMLPYDIYQSTTRSP